MMQVTSFNLVAPQQRLFSTEDGQPEENVSEQPDEKEDPFKYSKLGQEVFIFGLPESVTEE